MLMQKKNIFLAQKLTKLEYFLEISQNFMRKSLKSVTKIFEMFLIHNRGLKPTNKYIILHFSILLFISQKLEFSVTTSKFGGKLAYWPIDALLFIVF